MPDLLSDKLTQKTVFALTSPSGCSHESGVIRQAFLLVQQCLLDEKVDVAVLVLLDLLFPKFKYLQMRKQLCKKPVLSWPKNPRVQPLFWNNLRVALVSDNDYVYMHTNNEMISNNQSKDIIAL
uniref:TIR domain-containing protein n=1 Tax=Sinocyclocheilus grahami TaxID=75366 RepID=A0A672NQT5_SINGR